MHDRPGKTAIFRMYEELNDFLPPGQRKRDFEYFFFGAPAVKDAVEAIGVPHAEVDLILVNGESVPFGHHLAGGDRVSVYPRFESLDIGPVTRLRPEPLRHPAFILDVHLGKLARYLRMLGLDAAYDNTLDDPEIIGRAAGEHRAILTRDVELLKDGRVTHGYWVRSQDVRRQTAEVVRRFDLRDRLEPFTRCMACNGILEPVDKADILELLEPATRRHFERFFRCGVCGKIYWRGSHYERMRSGLEKLLGRLPEQGKK